MHRAAAFARTYRFPLSRPCAFTLHLRSWLMSQVEHKMEGNVGILASSLPEPTATATASRASDTWSSDLGPKPPRSTGCLDGGVCRRRPGNPLFFLPYTGKHVMCWCIHKQRGTVVLPSLLSTSLRPPPTSLHTLPPPLLSFFTTCSRVCPQFP